MDTPATNAPESSVARRTAIGAAWMVAWRFVTRALGMVSTLVLARILLPADFGLLAMASTFSAAVDAFSQLGVQEALVRRPEEGRDLHDAAFTIQFGRAVITGAVIALASPLAAWWFAEPRLIPVLLVLALGSLLSGAENIGIVDFRRELDFRTQFLLLAVPRLLQVATTIPLAFALRSYWALLFGIMVTKVLRLAMTYLLHPYRPRLRLTGWRGLVGFSFWTWATSVSNVVWERGDPVVLGPAIGPAGLGVYLLGFEIAILPVTELIAPAADALFAGFSSAQRQGTDAVRIALSVAVTMLLGIVPLVIAISAAAGDVVTVLLGPRWAGAQPLIEIMVWQCLFSPFSYTCSVVLTACGHVRRNFVANLIVSAVKLTTLVVATHLTHDLRLIAAGVTGCLFVECITFTLLLGGVRETRLRDVVGPLFRITVAAAATLVVLWQSGWAWQEVAMLRGAGPALLHGAGLAGLACLLFGLVVALLWLLAGQPPGPEARLLQVAGQFAYRGLIARPRLGKTGEV